MVQDVTLLKVVSVIMIMVGLSFLAENDPNNPLEEIGIPVTVDSFNIFALAQVAPQIQPITNPQEEPGDEEKYCWIDWFCPDLGFTDEIAKAIERFTISVANFFIFVANTALQIGTVVILLITNFLTIFNFASWTVFQGNFFLLFFGVALTGIIGGAVGLWVFEKVRSSIPGIG